jgi:hypothetical protein
VYGLSLQRLLDHLIESNVTHLHCGPHRTAKWDRAEWESAKWDQSNWESAKWDQAKCELSRTSTAVRTARHLAGPDGFDRALTLSIGGQLSGTGLSGNQPSGTG